MTNPTPLFTYVYFTIWPNRIEYAKPGWFATTETIFVKHITSVNFRRGTNALIITTMDGTRHTYHVMHAERAHQIILGLL